MRQADGILGLSVEIPIECGRCHSEFRWSYLWGHETCDGCAETGAAVPCGRCHKCRGCVVLWSHEDCEGYAETGAAVQCGRCHWGL
eukprot:8645607-Pyramimonas_sp.AAC.1